MKRKLTMSSETGDCHVAEAEENCNHSNQISTENNKVEDPVVVVSPLKQLRDMTDTASYRVLPKICTPDGDQGKVGRPIRRPSKCAASDSDTVRRRRRPSSGSSGENIPPYPASPSTEEENRKNANMTGSTPDIDGNANDLGQTIIPVEPDSETLQNRLSDVSPLGRKGSSPKRKNGGPANFEVLNPIKATNIRTGADRNSLPVPKPYIDVKLVKNDRRRTFASKSSENILSDTERCNSLEKGNNKPFRQNISQYHSAEDVLNNDPPKGKEEEEKIYSLPEPYTYGDSTLKAVKQITEKYDTLQRRKMRARSFRENQRCHLFSTQSSVEGARSPTRKTMAGSNPNIPVEIDGDLFLPGGVTQHDVSRIELFYCSQNTEVVVCECLTDLSIGQIGTSGEVQRWEPLQTGIPVFVLTKGLKRKTKRQLTVVVAERETGFPLWQDTINYLSHYKDTSPTFHTMFLSSDHKKVAGFQMYCVTAAMDFLSKFKDMTSDADDELWSMSRGKGSKKKKKFKFPKFKVPDKKEISQPCNFNHVTKVEGPRDPRLHSSFSDLLDNDAPVYAAEAPPDDEFRARAPTR